MITDQKQHDTPNGLQTLEQFRADCKRFSLSSGCEVAGIDESFYDGTTVTHLIIHEQSLCNFEQNSDGTFGVTIERDSWRSSWNAITARLYFEWYVSECVSEYTESDLCDLLAEFAEWSRIDLASADEMLLTLYTVQPECRTAQAVRDAAWLEWFCEKWESAVV